MKRLVFIVLPVVFFFLLSSPGLAQLSTFFDLLSQTPRFLTPESTSDTLSRYGETVLFPLLDGEEKDRFVKLVEEFQGVEAQLEENARRKNEFLRVLEKEVPNLTPETVEARIQEVIQSEEATAEQERRKLEEALEGERKKLEELEKERQELDRKYPLVEFLLWSQIDKTNYECRTLSGLNTYRFVLFLATDLPEPDAFYGEYGVFRRRLAFVTRMPFQTVGGSIAWLNVYTLLGPGEERDFNASLKEIEAKIVRKEDTIHQLQEAQQEVLRKSTVERERWENYRKTWQDLQAQEQMLVRSRQAILERVAESLFRWGYDSLIAPHFGERFWPFLVSSSRDGDLSEKLRRLEERFLILLTVLVRPVFKNPNPQDGTVTLSFEDVLSPAERNLVSKRMEHFPHLQTAGFSLEKYVFNKWQGLATLSTPLGGQSIPVKYVPKKPYDEYRLLSLAFPDLMVPFRYEHPQESVTQESPAPPQEEVIRSASAEVSAPQGTPPPDTASPPPSETGFTLPEKVSLGEEVRLTLHFPGFLAGGTLVVADGEYTERFPVEGDSAVLRLRLYKPGTKTLSFTVFEGEERVWGKSAEILVEKSFLGEPLEEGEEGYLLRVSEQLLEKLFGENRMVSIAGVLLFAGREGLVSYSGALLVAREVALRCGLPPGYDGYLKPTGKGVRLASLAVACLSEEFLWVEGLYDFRGRPVSWRLRQLEARKRDASSLLQGKGVSKDGEKLFPVNTEEPSLLQAVIVIPWEILQKPLQGEIEKGGRPQ